MSSPLPTLAKALIDRPLDLLPRQQRIRLWRHLLSRARGENDIRPEYNGEYFVLGLARAELARRPATVLDVGANVGDWTTTLCEGSSTPLRVFCFEPASETYAFVRDRLAKVQTGATIEVVRAAVGAEPGEAVLHVYQSLAGNQSLILRDGPEGVGGGTPKPETVPVVALDAFCAERGITELGFVKSDTEGFEVQVMKGLGGMLGRKAVGALQFEYNDAWIDARVFLKDAFDFLRPMGYTMARIHPRGIEVMEAYAHALDNFQFSNYLALRDDWLRVFPHIR
jgi:FkbM family methyltransferase